jgi:hypothetical protein
MAGDSVLTHHKNPSRDGLYVQPTLTKAAVTATFNQDPGFMPSLPDVNDAVYAQPLFVDGGVGGKDLVIVVTEANNVYAFDGTTGATVWKTNLGAPVPLAMMGCGNIDPFGVTGTPVIDLPSRTLFVTALVLPAGSQKHEIFALSIDTGMIQAGWPVDVGAVAKSGTTTFDVTTHGSRGALALLNGVIYAPFGGLYGDCGTYNGWVLSVPIAKPAQVQSWATMANGGGIWAAGGVSTDGTDLFVATGNTIGTNTWAGGDAVIRLSPGATFGMTAYFAPTNWLALDNADLDMGTAPVIFDLAGSTPSKLAIVFGKDGNAYLLDRTNLGSVSSPVAMLGVASDVILGAPAVYATPTATYVAFRGPGTQCTTGGGGDLTTIKVVPGSPPTLAPSWCGTSGSGSPMVTTSDGHADAIVWQMGAEGSGQLDGFDGDTGAPIQYPGANAMIPNMRRFNTAIAAKGKIYVAADGAVVAYKL